MQFSGEVYLYYYYVMCVMVRTGFNNLKYVKLIVQNTFVITSNHFIIRLRIQLEWPRMSLCLHIIMDIFQIILDNVAQLQYQENEWKVTQVFL